MNYIVIGLDVYTLSESYIQGALAARSKETTEANPYKTGDPRRKEWGAGHFFENSGEHVRFGVDVITAPSVQGKVFEDDPAVPRMRKKVDLEWYRIALMEASGILEAAKQLCAENGYRTPTVLRDALRVQGFSLDTLFARDLNARMRHDEVKAGRSLTDQEIEIVYGLKEPRRELIMALADLQDRYYHTMVKTWQVSSRCGKANSWAAATARRMDNAGEGFLIHFVRNGYCTLTPAGWTAARMLRELALEEQRERVHEPQDDLPSPSPAFR